ncbi:MAG TPA: hypothetical protein VK576_11115, partial [Thermoleophilia bacterium]|nr:hypothetical protein [Thermoleophilia bacterium]
MSGAPRKAADSARAAVAHDAPAVPVCVDAPPSFARKAAWVLTTLLATRGVRTEVVFGSSAEGAAACALAYAAAPVPGVPTLPLSTDAVELFAARRPLPEGSYTWFEPGIPGAFPAAGVDGLAVPFDLVASAFVLLAAWDEHTT